MCIGCDIGSTGDHCENCEFNVIGSYCNVCADGFYGLTQDHKNCKRKYTRTWRNIWTHHGNVQLLSKSLNTLSYFTQPPYHPSFSVLLKIFKSHISSMHLVYQEY